MLNICRHERAMLWSSSQNAAKGIEKAPEGESDLVLFDCNRWVTDSDSVENLRGAIWECPHEVEDRAGFMLCNFVVAAFYVLSVELILLYLLCLRVDWEMRSGEGVSVCIYIPDVNWIQQLNRSCRVAFGGVFSIIVLVEFVNSFWLLTYFVHWIWVW